MVVSAPQSHPTQAVKEPGRLPSNCHLPSATGQGLLVCRKHQGKSRGRLQQDTVGKHRWWTPSGYGCNTNSICHGDPVYVKGLAQTLEKYLSNK